MNAWHVVTASDLTVGNSWHVVTASNVAVFSDKLKHKLLADSLSEYFRKSNFKPISISVVARNSNARAQ